MLYYRRAQTISMYAYIGVYRPLFQGYSYIRYIYSVNKQNIIIYLIEKINMMSNYNLS
jgi:hypothetical protein